MKKRTIILLLSLSLPILPNCTNFDSLNYGTIVTGVKFANKTFSIKAIPANTSVIEVEVTGVGLNSSMKFNLTKDAPTKALQKVPVGSKLVTAVAKDSDGKVLARGESTIIIEGGKGNKVEVELKAVSTSSTINLDKEKNEPDENQTTDNDSDTAANDTDADSEESDSDSDTSDSDMDSDESDEEVSEQEGAEADSDHDSEDYYSSSSGYLDGEDGEYVDIDIQTTDGSPVPSGMSIKTPTPTQSSIQTAL